MSESAPSTLQLLAISGSLRTGSSNTALLEAAALLAPAGVQVAISDAVAVLPPFNPDLDTMDGRGLPSVVADFRARVGRADGLLLSSPEYAHGIAGAFKNALDWLVGSVEFPGKPVAVLDASPRSAHAPAQVMEVLTTMNARLVREACLSVPLRGGTLDAAAIAAHPDHASALRSALAAFARAIAAPAGA